jgi:hypothetical protein
MTGGGDCIAAGEGGDDDLIWPREALVEGRLPDLDTVYAALNKYQIVYQPAMSMYDR